MILDVKVPRAVAQKWNSWAERTFAKRAKLTSMPLEKYLNEPRINSIIRILELPYDTPIEFVSECMIDALRYNGDVFVHIDSMRVYMADKFKSLKITDLGDVCKKQDPKVA